MKIRPYIIMVIIHTVLIIALGLWWSENFTEFSRYKGDESWTAIKLAIAVTFIVSLLLKSVNKSFPWLVVIIMPVVTVVISAILTLALSFTGMYESNTVVLLQVFGIVHAIVAAVLFLLILKISLATLTMSE